MAQSLLSKKIPAPRRFPRNHVSPISPKKERNKPRLANLAKKKKETDNPFQKKTAPKTLTHKNLKKETNNQRAGLMRSQLAPPTTPA
jgi:hypothetical protein